MDNAEAHERLLELWERFQDMSGQDIWLFPKDKEAISRAIKAFERFNKQGKEGRRHKRKYIKYKSGISLLRSRIMHLYGEVDNPSEEYVKGYRAALTAAHGEIVDIFG
ncbi:MAG: hypothetical protein IKN54_02225 [Lachnospiraceae bacterium]|nr:hypothetical protein [Lachnospiraceae bacterium]